MKIIVKLVVLFAALFLVTGIAFAQCCADVCYKVTGTDLTNPANSFTQDWWICVGLGPGGSVCNNSGPTFLFDWAWFPGALKNQAISYDSGNVGAYMKFHGSIDNMFGLNDVFNGLYYNGTDRYKIHGVAHGCG